MGFHILRVTHTARSFFSSPAPEASTRRIVPVFEKRRAGPLSLQSRGGFLFEARPRLRPFFSPLPFSSPSSHPLLPQPRVSRRDPGCIGIPTQQSDRSAPGCLYAGASRMTRLSVVATVLFRARNPTYRRIGVAAASSFSYSPAWIRNRKNVWLLGKENEENFRARL